MITKKQTILFSVFTTFTNTNTYKEIKATLHPNPFTESAALILENLPGGNNTLCIMNAQGAMVKKMDHIGNGRISIPRDGLSPGFYYYQVRTQEGIVLNGKMAVQ